MLLNYHIGRLVLSSLCVGDLVRLGLSSVRVAGCRLFVVNIQETVFNYVCVHLEMSRKRGQFGRNCTR